MKKLFVGLIFLGTMLIVSCNFEEPTDEELFNELQKTLNNMNSYSCSADIIITGNKSPAEYSANHLFLKPNKYRIEYEDAKQIISYDGNKTYIVYPDVDKSIIIKDSKEHEKDRNLFIGYFIQLLFTSEDLQLESDKDGDKDYLVISVDLPGNNIYRNSQKLWINKNNLKPYKMIVLNKDGEETVKVYYKDFKYNIKISEETLFN